MFTRQGTKVTIMDYKCTYVLKLYRHLKNHVSLVKNFNQLTNYRHHYYRTQKKM
jgi:hypothetical protein